MGLFNVDADKILDEAKLVAEVFNQLREQPITITIEGGKIEALQGMKITITLGAK